MEKTIKIGEQEVRLSNKLSWALIYRDQFGRDIIPTIMPMLAAALDILAGIVKETGKAEELTVSDLAEIADGDALLNAYLHLSGLEFTDFINITWSLAKCADDSIPEPMTWVAQFEEFPVDEIGPVVVSLIFNGVVSSKNRNRLTSLLKRIRPESILTPSSSQGSSVDLP